MSISHRQFVPYAKTTICAIFKNTRDNTSVRTSILYKVQAQSWAVAHKDL